MTHIVHNMSFIHIFRIHFGFSHYIDLLVVLLPYQYKYKYSIIINYFIELRFQLCWEWNGVRFRFLSES